MAVKLGKRKRSEVATKEQPPAPQSDSDSDDDRATARALFQKAFEARFKPLEIKPVEQNDALDEEPEDEEDTESRSDWSGITSDEDEIEVIEHVQPDIDSIFSAKQNKNSWLSSKPPTTQEEPKSSRKPSKTKDPEEDGTDATNLKHDLALQRLLKESHLLDASSFSTVSGPEGKDRIKAIDLRLKDLGAKNSFLEQKKMPLSHRKGIESKAAQRESTRRREAAENGVILERQKFAAKAMKPRQRGLGGPGIGKMQGGTLKLSARDVRSIEGPKKGAGGRKGRKR